MVLYTVQSGETIESIAKKYGVSAERLLIDNGISPDSPLSVGQSIMIAYPKTVHTVQPGDSLWSIAASYGVTVDQLWRNNQILNGSGRIYPGQEIVVQYADTKRGSLAVTAYVYTFVEEEILRRTLPYLTYLAIFSYSIRSDGSLVTPEDAGMPVDSRLIALAREYGTRPMLVLTSLSGDGNFSTETVSDVLGDEAATAALISNIVEAMDSKGYDAINSDFEYIAPSDRDLYANFISRLTEALHPLGKFVDISLAPKTSREQSGLLYEAMDYPELGAAADTSFLMTYEWGYTYSEPRAVAPINLVAKVESYAASVIPRDKLLMGMPNYGYNWEIPWVEGSPARSLSNQEAVALANEYGVEILFDAQAATPHFNYSDGLSSHEVWFEDARSVLMKLSLAADSDLRGIGIWNATRWFPQLWFILNVLYNIRRD